ncbi:MAG: tetratricopeptide repeat protein, partial [Candidatus Magnetominusculus sp. LBB02]|nr:tetratricopeptide repeat protein [Candidatus Magnetominusculus sp. LBB02]
CQCGLGGAYRMKGLYDESFKCYTNAGNIFKTIKDRFGTAYSHCGIGNALRMKGRYDEGLRHLQTALKMYARIGDIVSSAYTLWSIGMLKLMVSEVIGAEEFFHAAAERFKKTLDVRGLIYADLGLCQSRYLYKHLGRYKVPLQRAEINTAKYSLQLEGSHVRKLRSIMEFKPEKCYNALGILELEGKAIPLNIP